MALHLEGLFEVKQASEYERRKETNQDDEIFQEAAMRVRAYDVVDLVAIPILDAPFYASLSHPRLTGRRFDYYQMVGWRERECCRD